MTGDLFEQPKPDVRFAEPKRLEATQPNNKEKRDLRRQAVNWIETHPKAAALILTYARQMMESGRAFGIGLLTERLRWDAVLEGWQIEEYKINNDIRAYLARWLVGQDPRLAGFIRMRAVRY